MWLHSENKSESEKAALAERHLAETHFAGQSVLFVDLIGSSGEQL
jgi:hypothetical protein